MDTPVTLDTPSTLDTADTLDTLTLARLDTLDTADTLDTLDLARLDRECQGSWEAEYSYGDEADLHRHYDSCTKNPDHKNFIPVDKFSIEDLPERYRDSDMVDYIRAVSDLTVRVTVKYVSDRRPATVGGSDKPYPGYHNRGHFRTTVGTGWVEEVTFIDELGEACCKCKDCRKSSTPQAKVASILIHAAAHVVYDKNEGEHTTCHLFFDRDGTPESCKGVVALTDMYYHVSDRESDFCEMLHYTHDLEVAQRLEKRCQEREKLRCNIRAKLLETMKLNFMHRQPSVDQQPLVFIVSHPHGCSKQISIGRWTSSREQPNDRHSYTYDTATCPGSSGAPVCVPLVSESLGTMDFYSSYITHVGVLDKQPGMNYSYIPKGPELYPYDSLQLDKVPWEAKFSCGEDEDLHKQYDTCHKNPGHQNFFPVDKFSMDNLPPFYRKNEIMEMIKCVSDLTVRVSVKYVSEGRPATVPGTDIPYPWHSNMGSNQLRVGSGCVTKVEYFKYGACECEECKSSGTPKIGCAHVYVETADHLVYDELEGKHTTCHLFFDSGETPDACKGVVTLRNMCYVNTKEDICRLMYKTHDLDLVRKLKGFRRGYVNFTIKWHLLKFGLDRTQYVTSYDLAPPLDIVVSHPHGSAKQIAIDYCDNLGNKDREDHQCLYNSIMCPGSSGAPVITLKRKCLYPSIE